MIPLNSICWYCANSICWEQIWIPKPATMYILNLAKEQQSRGTARVLQREAAPGWPPPAKPKPRCGAGSPRVLGQCHATAAPLSTARDAQLAASAICEGMKVDTPAQNHSPIPWDLLQGITHAMEQAMVTVNQVSDGLRIREPVLSKQTCQAAVSSALYLKTTQ